MKKYVILIVALFFIVSCNSYKKNKDSYVSGKELKNYTGPYYVVFSFSPPKSHLMIMGGIGDSFDVNQLKKDNLDDFIESFYKQLAYAPHIMDLKYSYNKIISCLGYNITWYNKYHIFDLTSDLLKEVNLELGDGNLLNIRVYRVLSALNVKYISDFNDCIEPSSIELDINKIKSIDKIAILLDKED